MKHAGISMKSAPRAQRIAALIAAVTVSASVLSTLLLAFYGISPQVWLAPTPEVMELVAHCEPLTARQAREDCLQRQVASRLENPTSATRLAQEALEALESEPARIAQR